MDEGDFLADNLSAFDPSVMRSGIPRSIDKVEPTEDTTDLVYRNVDVMSRSSVRQAAGGDFYSEVLRSVGPAKTAETFLFQEVAAVKPVSGRVTGLNQLVLAEPLQAVVSRVNSFLTQNAITSSHRLEGPTHCWDCHTISPSCQLVKFQIQTVQGTDGAVVNFKRERGCGGALSETFDKFLEFTNCAKSPNKTGRLRMQPLPLPDDEFQPHDRSEIEQALVAISQWIQGSPVEALQALGRLFDNNCEQLIKSENVVIDICRSIKSHESEKSDIIALTLGLSCLRKILSIYAELGFDSPMPVHLLTEVSGGLARATNGKCLTARREAGLLSMYLCD